MPQNTLYNYLYSTSISGYYDGYMRHPTQQSFILSYFDQKYVDFRLKTYIFACFWSIFTHFVAILSYFLALFPELPPFRLFWLVLIERTLFLPTNHKVCKLIVLAWFTHMVP